MIYKLTWNNLTNIYEIQMEKESQIIRVYDLKYNNDIIKWAFTIKIKEDYLPYNSTVMIIFI